MTDDNGTGTQQFEALTHFIAERLVPMQVSCDEIDTFRAGARSANLGVVQLCSLWSRNAFVAHRTNKLITNTGPEYLKVVVQLGGTAVVSQGDRQATLAPGDIVLYDTTRPYQISSDGPFQMQAVMMFVRDALPLSPSQLDRVATRPISGREGLGSVVSQYLSGLTRQLDAGGCSRSYHLGDATLHLLAALFTERLASTASTNLNDGKAGLLLRIRTYIEHRLGDPGLDVTEIAAAHHVSLRALQKLFESHGQTVTGWIRDRRIAHCREDLTNIWLVDQPVSAIAAKWGLVDPAHFSRLFKSTYGLPPRDFRASALSLAAHGIPLSAEAQSGQEAGGTCRAEVAFQDLTSDFVTPSAGSRSGSARWDGGARWPAEPSFGAARTGPPATAMRADGAYGTRDHLSGKLKWGPRR
jgi:AraC-like DNA-binding protein